MDRREFLKKSLKYGLAAGAALTTSSFNKLFAAASESKPYDLVAIKGGTPEKMFAAGIAQLGGMGSFVKKGQTVLVKPNIGWACTPELAANTNPFLVGEVVKACMEAGAKKVYVFDHTCDNWKKTYEMSGIEEQATKAGATVVSGANRSDYIDAEVPGAKAIKTQKVHRLVTESDVFINMPVLKSHGSATLTIAMKNLMGVVWDRRGWHVSGLHQAIADFAAFRKPDLNIVDAYRVMKQHGPRGTSVNDVISLEAQLISTDMVAIDAAAAKLLNKTPQSIKYITLAHEQGVGNMDLEKLNIKKISA